MTMARVHPVLTVCAVVSLAMAAGGCTRLSARSAPEPPPPLDVPAPPPRVVETAGAEPPNPGTLVDAPASGAPSSRRPPARVEAPKPETRKPESAPPPAPVTELPTVAPTEPAAPATTLQTTPPEKEPALEQEIRAKLKSAMRDLDRVDYGNLPNPAKQQYDQAKRFATLAEEAIGEKNLVYARPACGQRRHHRGSAREPLTPSVSKENPATHRRARPFPKPVCSSILQPFFRHFSPAQRGTSLAPYGGNLVPFATCEGNTTPP